MSKQAHAKRVQVIEAVRQGLEGDAAVEFIQNSGYAMTQAGIARHLRGLGGRGRVQELIDEGQSDQEIVQALSKEVTESEGESPPPEQHELDLLAEHPIYDTVKMTLTVPSDLHEALKLAAKAERTPLNTLIVDILVAQMSRGPDPQFHFEEEDSVETQ
jgi:hypothetical protein